MCLDKPGDRLQPHIRPTARDHQLFVRVSTLEYCGSGITLRTAWANIDSLRANGLEDYLWLRVPATVRLLRARDRTQDTWLEHPVPLRCVGYPPNSDLLADL